MRVRLSRKAQADIADIADYSTAEWGEARAGRYVVQLTDCDRLALIGRPLSGRPGLFRAAVESHFVFFRLRADELFIVRLLHRRRDIVRHLR